MAHGAWLCRPWRACRHESEAATSSTHEFRSMRTPLLSSASHVLLASGDCGRVEVNSTDCDGAGGLSRSMLMACQCWGLTANAGSSASWALGRCHLPTLLGILVCRGWAMQLRRLHPPRPWHCLRTSTRRPCAFCDTRLAMAGPPLLPSARAGFVLSSRLQPSLCLLLRLALAGWRLHRISQHLLI